MMRGMMVAVLLHGRSAVSGVADLQIQNTQLQRLQLLRQSESGGQGPYTLLVHLSTLLGRVACALGAAANSSSLRLRADLGDDAGEDCKRRGGCAGAGGKVDTPQLSSGPT